MDHRSFLKSLSPERRAALTRTADGPGLVHLAGHLGLIVALGAAIALRAPGWPFLMPVQGVLIVFLFTLLHETVHDTPFRTRWLNRAAGRLAGALIFLPATWFRYFHLAHHRHTQVPGKDPELAEPKPETWRDYVVHVSGLPVWRSHFGALFRNAAGDGGDAFTPKSKRRAVRDEARIMLALYAAGLALAAAFGRLPELATVWLAPLLLGQPFLRLYLLAEHGRCPMVADMFENTRTTVTGWAVRKLAWNMPYHAEHHAMPQVPFHRLPDLHKLAKRHLKVTERGYLRFHRRYAPRFESGEGG